MENRFKALYSQLNPAQKQAVDTIEGPLLVVAGPGTGKTQLLSLRVARILQKTDAEPGNILCLTFTNFASVNMRERLSSVVGSGAHDVVVRTFHSFAAEIIGQYPDYFWNGARLSIAPDAVQLEIAQSVLSRLPLDNPLSIRFAGAYTALGDVQAALKLTKEAGLTPDKLAAMLEVNEAYIDTIEPQLIDILSSTLSAKKLLNLQAAIEAIPDQPIDDKIAPLRSLSSVLKAGLAAAIAADEGTGKTKQTGKWKQQWIQTVNGQKGMFHERMRNAWWQALVEVYKSYRDQLHLRGYYDYSDMIIEVISQLEQQPELRADVQERFLYILIDEFQDTNAAQLRLAHLIAVHGSDSPNLMAVGDDDQSIFAFNGAELNNMLTFRSTYPDTKLIVLEDNYRSTQEVLDTAATIIEQAEDRLIKREPELTKQLKARSTPKAGTIEHISYPTREHQFSAISKRIAENWQTDNSQSLAVLARGHDSLKRLSAILNHLDIPIRYEQQNNILDQDIVKQIWLLADIVVAIGKGDEATVNRNLALLLRHPLWKIDPETIWKLAVENYRQPHWLNILLEHENEQLVNIGNWLLWLSQQAVSLPATIMIEHLIGLRTGSHLTSPIREYFLASSAVNNQYLEALSAVQVLLGLTQEFSSDQTAQLDDFVRFLALNHDLKRPINDGSWFVSGEQAIQLMTVHKAKGLEFDTVFIIDAIEDNWRPRHQGRKPPANLPLQSYGESYDDYIRLLYVAATRAKRSVIVSSYYKDSQGRELLASPLVTTALQTNIITEDGVEEPVGVLETTLPWPELQTSNEKALLQPRLDDFRLSATGLLQFLDVSSGGPQQFLERQLLHLPQVTTANMAYGTAVHAALQVAQQLVSDDSFSLSKTLTAYKHALGQQQLTADELARYQTHGEQILTSLFKSKGLTLPGHGKAEFVIGNIQLGEARLGGKLDHIVLDDDKLTITDYKTGKPLSSFTTRDQTKAIKAWRHSQQLLFYALLTRLSGRFKQAKSVSTRMVYVEAEQANQLELVLIPSDEALQRLSAIIKAVWQHIMNLDFPDTSGYSPDLKGIEKFENDLLDGKV